MSAPRGRTALALLACGALGGCAVASATAGAAISVTGAVVSTGVTLTGKALGAGIDAMAAKPAPADGSGIVVRERIAPETPPKTITTPCVARGEVPGHPPACRT